jgi:hypothetical protein
MAVFQAAPGNDANRNFGLGFDADAPPAPLQYGLPSGAPSPWLMVPHDNDAFVCLQTGAGLALQNSQDSQAMISITEAGGPSAQNQSLRNFTIRGLTLGNGIVEARQGSSVLARLQYTVFDRLAFSVRFFTVRDKGPRHWSRRALSDAPKMISLANKLFLPQANVLFTMDGPFADDVNLELPDILPDIRSMLSPGPHTYQTHVFGPVHFGVPGPSPDWTAWTAIFKPALPDKKKFNVFFVWRTDDPNTPALTYGNCCFIQDGIARPEHVFAHESGHFLLGPDFEPHTGGHSNGPADLMQSTRRDDFVKVPMDQAFRIQHRGW